MTGRDSDPQRPSEARRIEILRAALDLFSVAGFHGTTVRQIARAVGVNEATLYHYFPSKDAILGEVFQHVLAERRALLIAALLAPAVGAELCSHSAQVEALLRSVGETLLRSADAPGERKLTRLLMSEGPRLLAEGRLAFEEMHRTSMEPAVRGLQALETRGVRLGMQTERKLTILFADIRNFTGLSETMTPQENFDFLNSYLSQMEPMIVPFRGLIDKYIGDAIMALYPEETDDAVRSALAMLDRLENYNKGRARAGYLPI